MNKPILQTYNFPPISQPEQSWEGSLRALMAIAYDGVGRYQGLVLSAPPSGSAVPVMTPGYVIAGDSVVGPIPSTTMPPLPRNATLSKLYYAIPRGYFYFENSSSAATTVAPLDEWIATVSTTDETVPKLRCVGQAQNLGNGRFTLTGMVYLKDAARGSVKLLDFPKPSAYRYMRIEYGFCRIAIASTGSGTGDSFALEYETASLAKTALITLNNTALAAAVGSKTTATTTPLSEPTDAVLSLYSNLTDADNSLTAGAVEFCVGLQCF